jgi:DDE superfamily endonuclease/Archaeal putative transposase ISC1217
MWCMIESLQTIIEDLSAAFTQPSLRTAYQLLLGWIMCLGNHTLGRVAHSAQPHLPPDHSQRHGLDGYYNFFERSAWTAANLAYHVAVLLLTRLKFCGRITLLVDDTLAHKRGKSVWGMGWWRDAVASTKKRVATASGHNWVVLAVAYCLPGSTKPIFALPLLARLHVPGKGQPSCAVLAKAMLDEVLQWFPKHAFTLVGDGAYACKEMLGALDHQRVVFVGRLRGDACVYDPQVPKVNSSKRGPKAQKGPKLPPPKEAAAKADRKRSSWGQWLWRTVEVVVYGESRSLSVVNYVAVWPRVLGLQPIHIMVVRDPQRRMKDCYLFTTDLQATANWVVTQFAWRWAIEVLFRSSKQVMDIEAPQHWSQESVEKVAPWVWSMQSVIMVWYLTVGQTSAEALELREVMGDWDSEWSLRHMLQVLRRAILNATINPNSADQAKLTEMVQTLKNWANLAA